MAKPYKTVTLRLTTSRYPPLRRQAEASGLKMEPLLRQLIMGVNLRPRPPDTYAALLRELNAIGTNINQIAHNTNARKEAGQTDIDEAVKLVRQAYRFLMVAGTVGMTCIGAALFWAAPLLLKQFIPEDEKVIEIGIQALRMQCVVMPLLTLGIACNMTFQAVGQSVKATVLASLRQGIFFLPFIWVLPRLFGIYGMEAAQPAADAATFLVWVPVIWKFIKDLKKAK